MKKTMVFDKYTDIELITFYIRRKSLFPRWAEKAFQKVFYQYYHYLLDYYFSHGTENSSFEDTLNETFLSIIEHIESGRKIDNLKIFALSVFRNILRKNMMVENHSLSLDSNQYLLDFINEIEVDNVEEDSYFEINLADLIKFSLVNDADAEILKLIASGYKNIEISDLLGIDINTVSYRKHRAIKKIREYLGVKIKK